MATIKGLRRVHWVAAGMIKAVSLAKIERRKPDERDKAALKAISIKGLG